MFPSTFNLWLGTLFFFFFLFQPQQWITYTHSRCMRYISHLLSFFIWGEIWLFHISSLVHSSAVHINGLTKAKLIQSQENFYSPKRKKFFATLFYLFFSFFFVISHSIFLKLGIFSSRKFSLSYETRNINTERRQYLLNAMRILFARDPDEKSLLTH